VCDGGPFLEEEDRLLRAIGERLSKVLWLKRSEAALKESESRYRVLTEQVAEGVATGTGSSLLLRQSGFLSTIQRLFVTRKCTMHTYTTPQGMMRRHVQISSGQLVTTPLRPRSKKFISLPDPKRCFGSKSVTARSLSRGRPALLSTFKDITEIKEQQMAAQRMADLLDSENRVLRSSLKERYRLGDILGRSPAMQEVYELILKAAATDASVAIFGESGSGKELVAHAIHDHSDRKKERFVAVNCGAIQETCSNVNFSATAKDLFPAPMRIRRAIWIWPMAVRCFSMKSAS
jgi:hypothetical protein